MDRIRHPLSSAIRFMTWTLLSYYIFSTLNRSPAQILGFAYTLRCAMEALAAISLAGNILQFIDFSRELVQDAAQYHRSRSGMLPKHIRIEQSLQDLELLMLQLRDGGKIAPEKQRSSLVDEAIRNQVMESLRVGGEIRRSLDKMKLEEGKRSIFHSTRKAFRSIWTESYVAGLEDNLKTIQQGLNFSLSIEQRERVLQLADQQDEISAKLDNISRQIFSNVIQGKDPLDVDKNTIAQRLERIHGDAAETRIELSSKLDVIATKIDEYAAKQPQAIITSAQLSPPTSAENNNLDEACRDVNLYNAVRQGRLQTTAALLKQGADVSYTHIDGDESQQVLHLAARQHNQSAVMLKLLLTYSPVCSSVLNSYSSTGLTPLMIASIAGNTAAAAHLLTAGADFEAPLRQTRSSVQPTIDIDNTPTSGSTALLLAAQNGHNETVKLLLSHGADVDATSNHDFTPLIAASMLNHPDVVSMLLAADSNTEDATDQGFTSLIYAGHGGHIKVAELLLSHSPAPSIEAAKYGGMTALLEAVWMRRHKFVRYIASKGANVNARTSIVVGMDGATGLHISAAFGDSRTVRALLEVGADISLKDESGRTALELARERGQGAIVAVFEKFQEEREINT